MMHIDSYRSGKSNQRSAIRWIAAGVCLSWLSLFAAPVSAEVITFKNGLGISLPSIGIDIGGYGGTTDVSTRAGGIPGVYPSATSSNYGADDNMFSAQDGATSLLRFDISMFRDKFSAINSVKLVLYPRNDAVAGETMIHRVSDWNSAWLEGNNVGGFVCCGFPSSGANWNSLKGNFTVNQNPVLWASGTAGPNVPGTDYDAGEFVDGQLEGIGRLDNSFSVANNIPAAPVPFAIDILPQATSPFFPAGGTTASLFDLITDWASDDPPEGNYSHYTESFDHYAAQAGTIDPPFTPNEGFLIKGGIGSDVMDFWTSEAADMAFRPELIIDFTPLGGCDTGDADCDGDVDLDDIIAAVGSFTGPCTAGVNCFGDPGEGAPFDKVRTQGDVNNGAPVTGTLPLQSDGDVDLDDIIDMVGAFTGPLDSEEYAAASAGDAGLPDLVYDPATGEVFLDAADIGGTLQAYNIKNAGGGILNGNFTPILGGAPATDLSTEIGEFQLSATPTAPGGTSIGLVFPTGMDQAALEAFVTGGSAAPSFGGGSFEWELIALSSVPEPSTFILGGLGLLGLALVGYRRRRA